MGNPAYEDDGNHGGKFEHHDAIGSGEALTHEVPSHRQEENLSSVDYQKPASFPPKQQPVAFPPPGSQPNPVAFPPPGSQPNPVAFPFPGSQPTPVAFPPPGSQPTPVAFPPPGPQPNPVAFPPPGSSVSQPSYVAFQPPGLQPNVNPNTGPGFYNHPSSVPFPPLATVHNHMVQNQNPHIVNSVPIITPTQMPVSPNPAPTVPWSTQLFDCLDDPSNVLITFFFPCVTFGQIAEILDNGQTTCGTGGLIYGAIAMIIAVPCIYSCGYRSKLRARYNLEETPGPDWLVHFFCEWCALCQAYRELTIRGWDLTIGWQENMIRNQGVPPVQITAPNPQVMMYN